MSISLKNHSRHGTWSFVYALVVLGALGAMTLLLVIVSQTSRSPQQVLGLAHSLGGAAAFLWLGCLMGHIWGLVGLAQPGCRKSIAACGLVLNGLLFLGPLVFLILSSR